MSNHSASFAQCLVLWMTDATKVKALDKLHHIRAHVGSPDVWRDFSGLVHHAR